ncbi:MAG TPA: 3-oxoacyl-[acyl-carrier-protein] synthase III C-terminal domain-containing protein [Polyangiaceae bacterium]|nr:3-oxoacyl-[acyl-carrier-protein] synthase III C-terminal domain-containing protein [Polyangiaceae bacterium]
MQVAQREGRPLEAHACIAAMRRRLERFGCGSERISSRGHELDDCSHLRWDEMDVYRLAEHPSGASTRTRTQVFGRIASAACARLFAEIDAAPQHLIHVTCTGYEAPSAAQLLVASKEWGTRTSVTHAYHMGCYAALPALRIATGLSALEGTLGSASAGKKRVDIVHTELCSLHLNPLRHEPEQLVIQSLFADGCIAYSVYPGETLPGNAPGLAVVAQAEWLIPDSATSMRWSCSDFGMEMVLARDVPEKIARALTPFVEGLLRHAGEHETAGKRAVFAVHPGGPKIVDQVAAALGLDEPQIALSRAVLRERGNMSSATLPHIWQEVVRAAHVRHGDLVVSLAFGPGLTLSGAVLRKVSR